MNILSIVSPVFWGLVVLSLLVFVHEAGHYLAARAFGVRVTEFFLGMPFRYKLSYKSASHGTEIGVTPLLLGGYTRICGMEGAESANLAPALAYVQKKGRVTVGELAAELNIENSVAHEALDVLTDWAAIEVYEVHKTGEMDDETLIQYQTLARDAKLRTEYDRGHDFTLDGSTKAGEPHEPQMDQDDFLAQERSHTYLGASIPKRIVMLLGGIVVNVAVALVLVAGSLMVVGVAVPQNTPQIGAIEEKSLAALAGLKPGDTITAIDGKAVSTWTDMSEEIHSALSAQREMVVAYTRDGMNLEVTINPTLKPESKVIGISPTAAQYRLSLSEAVVASLSYAGKVAQFAGSLLIPTQTMNVLNQSSSVVGISVMASRAAESGVANLVMIIAMISMSLGFMNLLPIPPLDGGKILIEIIQIIIRRPLSVKVQNILTYIGLAFFLFIFVVALKNDIFRLLFG